jgi:hypothetical protein
MSLCFFADDVIILCVRWYLHFKVSCRDLAEIAWELGGICQNLTPVLTDPPSPAANLVPSPRDRHIHGIQENGRRAWQKAVGDGKRALVETAMFRYKFLIGPTLRARTFPAQKTEARVACFVLNRMAQCGMPASQRV